MRQVCDAELEQLRREAGLDYASDLRMRRNRDKVTEALWDMIQRDGLPSRTAWKYVMAYVMG